MFTNNQVLILNNFTTNISLPDYMPYHSQEIIPFYLRTNLKEYRLDGSQYRAKGPLLINDTARGINFRPWVFTINQDTVNLASIDTADGYPEYNSSLYILEGYTHKEISGAFDRNSIPVCATISTNDVTGENKCVLYGKLVDGSENFSYMFIETASLTEITSCGIFIDEIRQSNLFNSEIFLLYTDINKNLFLRKQSDRFLIEYFLLNFDDLNRYGYQYTVQNIKINNIGYKNNRIFFVFTLDNIALDQEI